MFGAMAKRDNLEHFFSNQTYRHSLPGQLSSCKKCQKNDPKIFTKQF